MIWVYLCKIRYNLTEFYLTKVQKLDIIYIFIDYRNTMTYKPKRNPEKDIYQSNPEKFSSNWKNKLPEWETEYFLKHGKMRDGTKRELSEVLEVKNKVYWTRWIINKIKDLLLYWKINKNNNKDHKRYHIKYSQIKSELNESKQIIKLKWSKFTENCLNALNLVCNNLWILVNDSVIDWNIYLTQRNPNSKWETFILKREIEICKSTLSTKFVFEKTLMHELFHHIWEVLVIYSDEEVLINNWYWHLKWIFITEWITELLTHKALFYLYNENNPIIYWYPFQIESIAKLIDLASKKLNKSQEYIYNYIMRWYLIKWNKWLSIFYNAFGRDFLKWLMELWTDESDKIKFIELVKNNYDKLWFSTQEEAVDYFDPNNKPSQEIGDIMGIEW